MSAYHAFTTSRTTTPDVVAMNDSLKESLADATAVLAKVGETWTGKKATDWTAPQIVAAQTILDTVPELTPQVAAQREIDRWPIAYWALVLTLVDEINILRQHPAIGLAPRTVAQAKTALRNKAGTLT